jgi:O-antigen/teichoic acid export membrane protein
MSQGNAMRRGVAWVFAGKTGDQFLSFAFGIVLARLLAPEVFGILLTIQVFTGLAGLVAGGGMGQALVRANKASKPDFDVVFTLQLLIGCGIYALFFIAAPLFARWYDNPIYTNLLRLSALTFIFRPLVNVPSNILYRQMRYKARAAAGLVTIVTSSLTSVTMAYLGHGVWSLAWGGIAGSVAQSIVLMRVARWRPGLSFRFRRGAELARYGLLVSANSVVEYVRSQINIFILSQSLGPASVGLYNKGASLAGMPFRFVAGSVYDVLFRAIAAEQDNLDKCRYLFARSIAVVAVYATPFYVALYWLAEPLIRGVYGERWLAAAGPLVILSFAWPLWLLVNMSGAVVAARNRLGDELQIQVATLLVTALAVVIALPHGIDGVAWAIVGAAAFTTLFMLRLAIGCLQAKWLGTLRALGPAALLNGILAAALYLAELAAPRWLLEHDLLHVAALSMFGSLVYASCALLLPIPALETERARWRSKLRLPNRRP